MPPHEIAPFEILLLEDEPADAYLIKLTLKENKVFCNVHHVEDGVEGLAFVRREGQYADVPRPDLILLDLNMPRMDGREFLREIKADSDLRSIPVLVLTTSSAERDIHESYMSGASGFVTKPVEMDRFSEIMRQIGDYWFVAVRLQGKDAE
ncbi:response regulator [Novispirillum sp. DQ9]|uniref:response regulator n=1 Tax=Novispirillum sp. DQ9 TaxID=3398612 RepID=UPI003C7E25B1